MNWRTLFLLTISCLLLVIPLSGSAQCPDEIPYIEGPAFGTLGTGDAWGQAARYLCPSIDEDRNAIEPCPCDQTNGPVYCDIPDQYCEDYWVEVDNPVTPKNPDFYQIGCDFPVGMEGDAINIRIHDFYVRAGYEMTFGGLDQSEQILVKSLALPTFLIAADFEQKLVFGYAGSGECVWVETECAGELQPAPVDPMGNWVADFSGITACDDASFGPGTGFAIFQRDEDGDDYNRHWSATLVPLIRCEGFEAPLHRYPVKARGKRALPLRATLFDATSQEVTGSNVISPPVVQVWFHPVTGDAYELPPKDVLPVGHADEGNQFVYSAGQWRFNLSTRDLSPGTYEVTMATSNEEEYMLDPYDTCMTQFVIE